MQYSDRLLGRHHPLVHRLRSLRRDARRRRAEGVLVAEGVHLAREALRSEAIIECVVASPRLEQTPEGRALRAEIAGRGIDLREADESLLDSLQDARSPQPILAVVRVGTWSLDDALAWRGDATPPLIVVADRVQDPGNLGGLLRTADAAGATGFVCCGESADLHHPRAVRATMGSVFRVPAAAVDRTDAQAALEKRGIRRIAAEPHRGTVYHQCDLTGAIALLLGGEGRGLDPAWLERADERARIPMCPGVESLSVGAAAGVLLFEAARQRQLWSG